ncbi:MAG: hypothetical protein V3W41_15585 [Planctomycetota bacterium]
MAHLFEFSSIAFDPRDEPRNSINPISGYAVLDWLAGELEQVGFEATRPPEEEDWGWYAEVSDGGRAYLVGASGPEDLTDGRCDWIVQIEKRRSLLEKLTRKNVMQDDERLLQEIEGLLRRSPDLKNLYIEANA